MDRLSIAELLQQNSGIKLDIACGENKTPGYVGMDVRDLPGVDILWDAEVQPWPLPDECVVSATCSHYMEHINPAKFGVFNFMNELWRVMRTGSLFIAVMPYGVSPRFIMDPTHTKPYNENTWRYFDPLYADEPSPLYTIYRPKPWKMVRCSFDQMGDIEVMLSKRMEDVSYGL